MVITSSESLFVLLSQRRQSTSTAAVMKKTRTEVMRESPGNATADAAQTLMYTHTTMQLKPVHTLSERAAVCLILNLFILRRFL